MVFRSKKQCSNKITRKRKTKSTKPRKQSLYSKKYKQQKGGDIESNEQAVIVTIAIITHGCIITTNTATDYDIRLYSATGNRIDYCVGTEFGRSTHHDELKQYYRKDNPNPEIPNPTVNQIPEYFDQMPYDKIIGKSQTPPNIFERFSEKLLHNDAITGVWLISVHDHDHKLLYPTETMVNDKISFNLLNINGLNALNTYFNKTTKIDYEKILVNEDKPYPKKNDDGERNITGWNVSLNNESTDTRRIEQIRLSYVFDLMKEILGNNVKLNVYDYSCSTSCGSKDFIPDIIPPLPITDIEHGRPPYFQVAGSNKKKKKKKTI
tara:strand:+ start:400 stop:1365 length:966 start_codon:yes stop_codon:yes gene_type:complete